MGIYKHRKFPVDARGAVFVVKNLPAILGTKKIPTDISKNRGQHGINIKYEKIIVDYTIKYIKIEESCLLPDGVTDASLLWVIADILSKLMKNEI